MMSLDAIGSIVHTVERDWGTYGYSVWEMKPGRIYGHAIAEVHHADGSTFYVGADRWGNVRHADTRDEVADALLALVDVTAP